MIGLIKMFRDRSRISKVARVKDGAPMFPKSQSWSLLALGLCNVLFAASLIGPSHKLKMPGKGRSNVLSPY